VLVADNHSVDPTVSIATALAQYNPQFRVLSGPPLAPHWIGKSHACWVGAITHVFGPVDALALVKNLVDMLGGPLSTIAMVAIALAWAACVFRLLTV
jgi:hypothetical protein